MTNSYQQYTSIAPILVLSLALTGCDLAADCIDDDGPELSPRTLPNPILNQEYDEIVHVGIVREPFDDRFTYEFNVSGTLPDGLQTDAFGQDLRIFGTPIEQGDFDFSVRVRVVEPSSSSNQTAGLCRISDTQGYRWTVQIM